MYSHEAFIYKYYRTEVSLASILQREMDDSMNNIMGNITNSIYAMPGIRSVTSVNRARSLVKELKYELRQKTW